MAIVGIVVNIIIVAIIGACVEASNDRQRERVRNLALTHVKDLMRKRAQLVTHDAYGGENTAAWDRERRYFIKTHIYPNLYECGKDLSREEKKEIDRIVDGVAYTTAGSTMQGAVASEVASGRDYEHYCARLLSQYGWQTRLTKASGDQGVDIFGRHGWMTAVFQCKFYTQPVGNKAVQEVVAARIHERAEIGVVISNAAFTRSAEILANSTGTFLIHHENIPELVDKINKQFGGDARTVNV